MNAYRSYESFQLISNTNYKRNVICVSSTTVHRKNSIEMTASIKPITYILILLSQCLLGCANDIDRDPV